jgi:hypothetical protein
MVMSFIRHGSRSTIVKNCFYNAPERVYKECPSSTTGFTNGILTGRSSGNRYNFKVKPHPGKLFLAGDCHRGQLTETGILMSYNNGLRVGSYLNKTYSAMGLKFSPLHVSARSTDVHRTRETAESFLTGLSDSAGFTPNDIEQMAPIYFRDADIDSLKLSTSICNTTPYVKEAYAADEWLKYKSEVWEPLQAEVATVLGQKSADLNDVFDCSKINLCNDTPNPSGLSPELLRRVEQAVTQYWIHGFHYDLTRSSKLFTGPLITEIVSELSEAVLDAENYQPKYSLYSGHDFGPMMNLAAALGILAERPVWPPYSAMIQLDLVLVDNDPNKTYIRFTFQAEVVKPAFCAEKWRGDLCPASVVIDYLSAFIPSEKDCPRMRHTDQTSLRKALERAQKRIKNDDDAKIVAGIAKATQPLMRGVGVAVEEEEDRVVTDVDMWEKWANMA